MEWQGNKRTPEARKRLEELCEKLKKGECDDTLDTLHQGLEKLIERQAESNEIRETD